VPAKRFTDIEIAVRWAYREELPKRRHGGDPIGPALRTTAAISADEHSDRDPGFPAALGAPHPDALAIEAAVKGLAVWRGHGFGPDDAAGLMHNFEHMDVDHLAAGVEAVANMPAIIAVHARAGTRPRWTRALPEPFPVTGANGKPKVLIDETLIEMTDKRGRVIHVPASALASEDWPPGAATHTATVPCRPIRAGLYRAGAYCPLMYRPAPSRIVAERAEYAAWRMGLELLHQALEGRLATIAVLPPAAPWRPWAGEGEAHGSPPQLFCGQRDEPHRRETREQAAARRRASLRRQASERGEETRPSATDVARKVTRPQ